MWLRAIAILTCLLTGASCASPAERFASRASKRGFAADVVVGTRFSHLVLRRIGPGDDLLHVYLDGDGTPMRAGVPASDPTPRDPLVLDLMALDGAPSVYIGRPCYHGIRDPDCRAELWTSARYSETVVESLVAAVRRVISATGVRRVAWIGHSGGGALARLAAPRLSETVALVTVGANLALQSWATMRRLPPLHGSLDPAAAPPLPAHVYQRHYVGSRDRVVPPEVVRLGAPPAAVVIVTGYGHVCCWTERWPAVLADLATGLAQMSRR